MNITFQDALLINSILYSFGFIIVLFVILKYKNKLTGLNSFGYYFLFNSIGVGLMIYRDTGPYFLTIIVSNYLLILGSIYMVNGVLKFYNRKIPYKAYVGISIISILGMLYFTYIDFNFSVSLAIFGVVMLLLHFKVLKILREVRVENDSDIEMLSITILVYLVSMTIRAIILSFSSVFTTFFEANNYDSLIIIFIGISGSLISVGVISLINSRLLNNVKDTANSLSNVIFNSPIPVMIHTEDGKMLYISDEFTRITGYILEDVSTIEKWIFLAYNTDREKVRKIIHGLFEKQGEINDNVIEIIIRDRSTRIWSFHSGYIGKSADGINMAMSVAIDVTDEKEKELEMKKLQKSNEKLIEANRIAVKLADMLVWRLHFEDNTDQNYIYVNESYARVMGWTYKKDNMIAEKDFLDSIYKDTEGDQSYKDFYIQHERVHNNEIDKYVLKNFKHINATTKESVYLEHHTKVEERYPDGKVKVIGGYVIDVTESFRTEKKIQFERDKAQKYLDIIGNILVALDTKGNITLLNNKGCEILEVEEKDALGKNWFDEFIPKEIKEEVKKVFAAVFSEEIEMATQYENTVVTKTGKTIIVNWYNSILYDIDGEIIGIISSGEDVTEKRKYEENLREIGYRDALTGLYNRRYYEERLKDIDNENNYPISIVMGDINGLKLINDAFGHNAGDELLISAANVILNSCRKTDLVARIGGDEFVVAMPNTTEEEAENVISSIHERLKFINIESIQLSISFGIKTKINVDEDIQEIYRSAEDLMYREKLLEIPSMRSGAIETILNTLYEKDKSSEIHSRTVSLISEKLAKASGMSRQDIAETKTAGLLHDIGKIIISLSIINKEGKLTTSEYTTMKTHSEIGFRILNSTSDMRGISNIVLCHHERWDGAGYPRGIKTEEIPVKARIIAIADAYDAMTSERTYRDVISKEDALKEIVANGGTQFDPKLVKVFEKYFEKIIEE